MTNENLKMQKYKIQFEDLRIGDLNFKFSN
jgi:hypothetical protein